MGHLPPAIKRKPEWPPVLLLSLISILKVSKNSTAKKILFGMLELYAFLLDKYLDRIFLFKIPIFKIGIYGIEFFHYGKEF